MWSPGPYSTTIGLASDYFTHPVSHQRNTIQTSYSFGPVSLNFSRILLPQDLSYVENSQFSKFQEGLYNVSSTLCLSILAICTQYTILKELYMLQIVESVDCSKFQLLGCGKRRRKWTKRQFFHSERARDLTRGHISQLTKPTNPTPLWLTPFPTLEPLLLQSHFGPHI